MRELVNYQSKEANFLTKQLWRAAGADENVLKYCSYTDHVKYAAIGGIIVFTALLAGISAGFAVQSIFKTPVASVIIAIFWSIMIYNLDRFIVAATGKGDGKEGISWYDLKLGWPRILLAVIIGVVISAPLEVKIMEPEINQMQVHENENISKKLREKHLNKFRNKPEIKDKYKKIDQFKIELNDLNELVKLNRNRASDETSSAKGGPGRNYNTFVADADKYQKQAKEKGNEIKILEDEIRAIEKSDVDDKLKKEMDVIEGNTGLMSKLSMADKYAEDKDSEAIPWLIRLFFIILEITPILTKMMLIKSPYDYLSENLDEITKAKQAIEIRHEFLRDENGQLLTKTLNYVPMQVIKEQKDAIEAQERLSQDIIAEWEKRELKNVKDNLDDYITKA